LGGRRGMKNRTVRLVEPDDRSRGYCDGGRPHRVRLAPQHLRTAARSQRIEAFAVQLQPSNFGRRSSREFPASRRRRDRGAVNNMATAKDNVGLDRLVEIWNRRKWLALAVFVILFTSAACISSFLPDAYRSTVTLLVESQQVPSDFVRSTVTSGVERRVYTIAQAILSRERLDGLIKEFSLYENLKGKFSPEETIEQMRRDIFLDVKGYDQRTGSNTTVSFTISYIGDDARKVAS